MAEKEYIERGAVIAKSFRTGLCDAFGDLYGIGDVVYVDDMKQIPAEDVAPRSEVAREIFEGLERLMLDGAIGGKYPAKVINPDKYAEFKKKYVKE